MKNSEILNIILKTLPYPDQIRDVDMVSEDNAIRFSWRSNRFRVSSSLHVETVKDGCLHGCDLSIVVRQVLRQAKVENLT